MGELKQKWLAVECIALFVLLPAAMWYYPPLVSALLLILWGMTFYALFLLARTGGLQGRDTLGIKAMTWRNLRPILLTFAVCASAIALFTWALYPQRLFSFPRENPAMWAMVMVFYPILSALPQEVIYRTFFFHRYAGLFQRPQTLFWVNILLFSFFHIIMHNVIAVGMTLVGGWLFARTYLRHRSLLLVTIEHTLYGCFIFTIGLGWFFYRGGYAVNG